MTDDSKEEPALSAAPLSALTTDQIASLTTVDLSALTSSTMPTFSYYAGATGSTVSSIYTTAGANGTTSNYNWGNLTSIGSTNSAGGLHVKSDAEFEGDIKWKGRSLEKLLEKIEDRLAILQDPDPAKLEKHAALKKAYEHYKLLEKLIGDD